MKIIMKALILGSLLISGTAFAQTASTPITPTAPTLPQIVATSPNEIAANSIATTNKVYVDQAGNNPNINIQQTGVSNSVGNVADPVYLRGDNQNVAITQTGNTNSILMGIIGNTGGTAAGITATIQQLGNNNSADIRCGTSQSDSKCNNLNLNARFTGNYNSLTFKGSAANITQTIDAAGNNNAFTINDSSPNSSQTLLFNGDYNIVNATQTGTGGTYGHSLLANFTGTGNTLTTQQYGPSETIINIKSVGSNGTYNIKTGH
jgi:hypothetical protein